MYYVMLAPGNTEFVTAISRGVLRSRSRRLDAVVAAMEAAQKVRNAQTLSNLLNLLHAWCTNEQNEYANRGGTNGVAYRLWMEAKHCCITGITKWSIRLILPCPPAVLETRCSASTCRKAKATWRSAMGSRIAGSSRPEG